MIPIELYVGSLIVAGIGVLLGILTFVNQFVVSFKPRVFFNNFLELTFFPKQHIEVDSLTICLTFSNSKNTYGVVNDFSVGMFEQNEVQPRYKFMFPESVSEDNIEFTPFSPIVLSPRTHSKLFLRFRNRDFDRTVLHSHDIDFDLFLKFQGSKKWKKCQSVHLFKYENRSTKEITYKVMNFDVDREPLKRGNASPPSTIYKGNIGAQTTWFFGAWRQNTARAFRFIVDLPISFWLTFRTLVVYLFKKVLLERIAIKEAGRGKGGMVTFVPVDPYVVKTHKKITTLLEKFLKKSRSGNIEIEKQEGKTILTRNGYTVSVYYSGGDSIYAHTNDETVNMNFEFRLKRNMTGYRFWLCESKTYGEYEIALRIFDHFGLYSTLRK